MSLNFWRKRTFALALISFALVSMPSALGKRGGASVLDPFSLLFLQFQLFYMMHSLVINIAVFAIVAGVVISYNMPKQTIKKEKSERIT